MLLSEKDEAQGKFAFIEGDVPTARYEYAVLVTSTTHPILTLAQLYRDRADSQNNFDELKRQWGWGGFTTQDLARCQLMARMVALVYNWWTLFVRLAQPHKHFEAISNRPLLLQGVATQTWPRLTRRSSMHSQKYSRIRRNGCQCASALCAVKCATAQNVPDAMPILFIRNTNASSVIPVIFSRHSRRSP